jgi:HEAT repeat protein
MSPTTDELIRAAGSEDPFARADAIGQLRGRAGAEPTLLGAIRDDYPQVRRAAIRSLVGTGDPDAIRAVIDVVDHDPSAEVRAEALDALEVLAAALAKDSHRRGAGETG